MAAPPRPSGGRLPPRLLPLLLLARPAGAQPYTLLESGLSCAGVGLAKLNGSALCFGSARDSVGLSAVTNTLELNGIVDGCVYNTAANSMIYGSNPVPATSVSLRYLCEGVLGSTTTTSGTTTSLTATSSSTATSSTQSTTTNPQVYSLINFGETCASYQLPDLANTSECFSLAGPYVGLGSLTQVPLPGIFDGCAYNPADSGSLIFSSGTGSGPQSAFLRPLCRGLATTTTSTTSVTSTTTGTTTSVTSTSTTSLTSSTSTSASSTSSTTETLTTTTATLTTTTKTATTSTHTTTTYTGSRTTTTSSTATGTTVTATTTSLTTSSTTSLTSSTSSSSSSSSSSTTSQSSTSSSTLTSTTVTSTTTATTTTRTTSTTQTTTATTSTVTTTTVTTAPTGFVGDDPISLHDGVARRFYLPEEELVELVRTPELRLLGAAVGTGLEQFIRRIVLASPAGEPVLSLAVKDRILPLPEGSQDFGTLEVSLDWLSSPLPSLPPPEAFAYTWQSLVFAFGRLPHFQVNGTAAEVVVVEGSTARVVITSVEAGARAHLDFVLQLKQRERCEGLLPELWGLRPMSAQTSLALSPESPRAAWLPPLLA